MLDANLKVIRELPSPFEIKEQYPLDEECRKIKEERDQIIKNIFTGKDKRLLLIIGPCSADREDAVMEYMHRLKKLQKKVIDKIVIVPRVYTNKPRTKGIGYKGMLHQPDPTKEEDMLAGIIAIRELHLRVIRETGFTCADEMLYPENYAYLSDLLAYVAVGARSVENQLHRMVGSIVNVPVGMKNPTSGDYSVMMNAIIAANAKHRFVYRGYEVESKGNNLSHCILRGYVDKFGNAYPNYHYEELKTILKLYEDSGIKYPAVIVDCNHSNSGKQYEEQMRIASDVIHSRFVSKDIHKLVKGLMIESYLVDGNQKPGGEVYGQSITDACIGWEKTEKLVLALHGQLGI
ncbi:MAG: 3-deoxy-7-phosphoheptulonate synthase [Erysipelotrichaceae bacterium]|nr:3-deoxy-7-phosphoheptulonate synthase [Erysipelotrichaceae bacterium]